MSGPSAARRLASLDDLEVAGRRALVRADLNVPMDGDRPTDTLRLERLAPTLRELASRGARTIVISHRGRPKGTYDAGQSLRPVAVALARVLGSPVTFAEDCVGGAARRVVDALGPGEFAVLENLRFHPGEEANDPAFVAALAAHADAFINDAFSSAHRAHASTVGLASVLPAAAGRGMEAELEALGKALDDPARPLAAIIGGAKVSSKIAVLENLVARTDIIIIGGGMANTFLLAQGIAVGSSLCEPDFVPVAHAILARAEETGCAVVLPGDAVVARELAAGVAHHAVSIDAVPVDMMILDVGAATAAAIGARLEAARTLVWNGPLGAFETPPFDAGTSAVARAAADLTRRGQLLSIAGGGDTVAALAGAGVDAQFTYLSAAGGAFLDWLGGKALPGVEALRKPVPAGLAPERPVTEDS